MEANAKSSGFNEGSVKRMGGTGRLWVAELVLRVLAVATTLAAAIIMGEAKETETVPVQLVPSLPAIPIAATAKSSYSSAFVYFVVANAVACGYSVVSLGGAMASKGNRGKIAMLMLIMDEIMVALLFSGNGAAAAIGVVGENGNSHVGWNKICNVFTKFCTHVKASVMVSLVGALAYLLLASFRIISLHKRDP